MSDRRDFLYSYDCTSPTLLRFHASAMEKRVITGPFGSGKSYACCGEVMRQAIHMPPCVDGVRRSKVAFLRDTATNLRDTTMQTWLKLFPAKNSNNPYGLTVVRESPQLEMTVTCPLSDGTSLELIIIGRHQSCPADIEDLKSLELTALYINELTGVPQDNVRVALSRLRRYPDKKIMSIDPATGEPHVPFYYMIADTNMPDDMSWIYDYAEVSHPKDWEFFKQPPAMFCAGKNPKTGKMRYIRNTGQKIAQGILPAENIDRLSGGWAYYESQIAGNSYDFINVFVCANYGNLRKGMPVYINYNDLTHYTDEVIAFDRSKTLFLGFDWGLWPSVVFCQMSDAGQLQVLEELDGEGVKMGIEQLWTERLRNKLVNDYAWGRGTQIFAVGDPAVGTSQVDMNTCVKYLGTQGLEVVPCHTNDPATRQASVDAFLRATVTGGKAAFTLTKKTPTMRQGMAGRYCFELVANQVKATYRKVVDKNNPFSHLQDALQYICHALRNPTDYNFSWRNHSVCGWDGKPVTPDGGSSTPLNMAGFC